MIQLFKKIGLVLGLSTSICIVSAADYYPTLKVGGQTYSKVHVMSANASSLSIRHSKGLAQVKLSELEPDLQVKYGYDKSMDQERAQGLAQARNTQANLAVSRLERLKEQERRQIKETSTAPSSLGGAFASFGQKPEIRTELDLRGDFRKHSLSVRNQGARPSCSIHSIVAALEYQYAESEGVTLNISEDYLLDATSRTVGRTANVVDPNSDRETPGIPVDAGFALEEVFQAIRGFGLAVEKRDDIKFEKGEYERIQNVKFSPYMVPGTNSDIGIQNLIHVLNARMPVVVGMAWPSNWRVQRTSLLSKQPPREGAGHAVTLVGYRSEDGSLESTKFIFRNSWGPRWGTGGYGFVTYEYLKNNLQSCYVVELR